jgi:4-amino-4-deoxy-L-arabinose transferase-like glycosyltransferase
VTRFGPFSVLIVLAFAVRFAFVLLTPDLPLLADTADYHRLAVSVSEGDGFGETVLAEGGGPTAFRAPLFPAALGLLYAVVGPRILTARIVLAFAGTLTVALIALLAYRWFGRRAALIATAIAALYPSLILASGTLITEAVFLPLELGALAAATTYVRSEQKQGRWLVLAGVLAGLTALSRQAGLVLIVGLAILVLTTGGPVRRAKTWVAPLVLGIAALVVVAPWTIRNAVVMDYPFIVSADDGFVFAGVFNDDARTDDDRRAVWRPPTAVAEHAALFEDPDLREGELALELRSRGIRYAIEHPTYAVLVKAKSAAALFEIGSLETNREAARFLGYGRRTADVETLGWFLVAALGVAGAFSKRARQVPWGFWLIPVLFTAITVIVLGTPRYRAPMEPFVVLLAALGADAMWSRLRPN